MENDGSVPQKKLYNFYFTAEINGTTTRAMYQELGLDLED